MVRRLSAILNVYPPNRSTRVMKMSRKAASQRCPVQLSEDRDQHDRKRHQRSHPVHHADEATGGRGQRKGNRDELKRQIDRGEPRHVESETLRRVADQFQYSWATTEERGSLIGQWKL